MPRRQDGGGGDVGGGGVGARCVGTGCWLRHRKMGGGGDATEAGEGLLSILGWERMANVPLISTMEFILVDSCWASKRRVL